MRISRFTTRLVVVVAAAAIVRIAYALYLGSVGLHPTTSGDAFHYHHLANLVADGHGYLEPFRAQRGATIQAASHPPLFPTVLAVFSMLGFRGAGAHQVVSLGIGVANVFVIALLARRVAGERVGLVAGWFAALYPALWIHDALVLSESLAILTAALAVLAAYNYVAQPGPQWAAVTGAAIGLAALARSENLLLFFLVLLPVVVLAHHRSLRMLGTHVLAAGLATALVLAPWTAYNISRFEQPVLLSDQLGLALVVANCDATYYGKNLGFWSLRCSASPEAVATRKLDRSERDVELRGLALDYISENRSRVPVVMAARVGRVWSLYDARRQIALDTTAESRELKTNKMAFVSLCAAMYLAVLGSVALRRRGVFQAPLLALPLLVTVTSALVYGSPRFRAVAEVTLVIFAAVALEEGWRRWRGQGERPEAGTPISTRLVRAS